MRAVFVIAGLVAIGIVGATELDSADRAEIHRIGEVSIVDPWANSSIGGAHVAKLFFEFRNESHQADQLLTVTSPVASGPTYFRVVTVTDGKRQINNLEVLSLPAGARGFELSEIGYYIELTGLEEPVLMGKRVPVTLTFARAGTITIDFTARFHSPKLTRRIREAAKRGDIEALKALRPSKSVPQ